MAKCKNKEDKENREKRRHIRLYTVYQFVMMFAWGVLIFDVGFRLCKEMSFLGFLGSRWALVARFNEKARTVINAESVLEMVKAIGICSTLITWVYSSMDKLELGLRYSELLDEIYPRYNLFVLGHFTAILVAICLGYAKLTECAAIALGIVILGCGLQWKTLENVVLSSQKRARIAEDRWRNFAGNEEKRPYEILGIAGDIAVQINKAGSTPEWSLIRTFDDISALYIKRFKSENVKIGELLRSIYGLWEKLFSGKKRHERETVAGLILTCSKQKGQSKNSTVCPSELVAAYVLWLHHYYMDSIPAGDDPEQRYGDFYTELSTVVDSLEDAENTQKYIYAFFYRLSWLHFLLRDIGFDSEWLAHDTSDVALDDIETLAKELIYHEFHNNFARRLYLESVTELIDKWQWTGENDSPIESTVSGNGFGEHVECVEEKRPVPALRS